MCGHLAGLSVNSPLLFLARSLACALCIAVLGCGDARKTAPDPHVLQPPLYSLQTIQIPDWQGATQLAPAVSQAVQSLPDLDHAIPLDELSAGPSVTLTSHPEGLQISSAGSSLQLSVTADLRLHNQIRVRVAVDPGGESQLNVSFNDPAASQVYEAASATVLRDGAFHDYVFRLPRIVRHFNPPQRVDITLSGSLQCILSEVALQRRPPDTWPRLELQQRTCEILRGSQPDFELTVPPGATFHGFVAYVPPENDMESVQFRLVAITSDGDVELASRTLSRAQSNVWRPMECSLEQFAGTTIGLRLEVHAVSRRQAAYAIWGAPGIVDSLRNTDDDVPVILISLDTLRSDHLGCYGYERDTSPNIDAWRHDTALFNQAFVYEPWTLTSHMSMMTGMHHERHGVNHANNLNEERVTLAERLRDVGYRSAAFVGESLWLLPWRGFQQGMDEYTVPDTSKGFESVATTIAKATDWIRTRPNDRFFLFFHTYEIHSKSAQDGFFYPYVPSDDSYIHFGNTVDTPEYPDDPVASAFLLAAMFGDVKVTPEQRRHMIAMYDDGIRMTDAALLRLFDVLKKEGLYDKALIVLTADHGEAFGHNNCYLHSSLYDSCVRVPLLVKFPNGRFAGQTFDHMVTSADILPTVLDVLNLTPQQDIDGFSLVAAATGAGPFHQETHLTFRQHYEGVRTSTWKLIYDYRFNRFQLYNMIDDPDEQQNVYDQFPEVAKQLSASMAAFTEMRPGWHFSMKGGGVPASITIQLSSESGPLRCIVRRDEADGSQRDEFELSENRMIATATFRFGWRDADALMLFADGPVHAHLRVTDENPVTVATGNQTREIHDRFDLVLDPADPAMHLPESTESDHALLRIWYVPNSMNDEPSQELTPEQIQRMESLGYLAP